MSRPTQAVELIRRQIVADPVKVAATVALVRRSGRLVDMTRPRQLPDGRALVVVTLRPRPDPRIARRRTAVAIAASVAAALAYVTYLITQLVEWLAAHIEWLTAAVLLLVVVAFLRPNHRAICPGLHCSGCKGGRS